ncbi:MAG: AmmeMemoRadiSam system protein B [Ignavibacteriaceae bacterium]|nr:AmmeMemoRadiSam system protein B [Ignavibacteriaceae bacterium]
MKPFSIKISIVILLCVCFSNCKSQTEESLIRNPAVAGKFYPADSLKLRNALKYFFMDAVPGGNSIPLAIITPHAGYLYSGQIAADAFNQTKNFDYDIIVILGTNHTTAGFNKISVYPKGGFRTPLGIAHIDQEITEQLIKNDPDCVSDIGPHESEHSVEVEIPFIQYLFPKVKIVPVIIGTDDPDLCIKFGKALAGILKDKKALIVASSDLSHYPKYEDAVSTDKSTLNVIKSMNTLDIRQELYKKLNSGIPSLVTCACGEGPILTVVTAVKELGGNNVSIISYANSGITLLGDKERVVGYSAIAFYKTDQNIKIADKFIENISDHPGKDLDSLDKVSLLKLARRSIEQYLASETLPLPRNLSPGMNFNRGAFVTIKKQGELRGCVGSMSESLPLYAVVGRMALQAAFNDNRFHPLEPYELSQVKFEISVLTPMIKINSIDDIVLGRDGVLLKKGNKQAVFLPQVATEQKWNMDQFLTQLCYKAGLNANDWKTATLYTFRAEVFSEEDFQ